MGDLLILLMCRESPLQRGPVSLAECGATRRAN